jgi:hypothetical protein
MCVKATSFEAATSLKASWRNWIVLSTRLPNRPQLFPSHLHGTRFYRLHRFPYLVVYRMTDDEVFVVAVAHHRRRVDYWADRLE